jgi:phage N-6-adenine-methyltransferase
MARPKVYPNNAERQRAYRQRLKRSKRLIYHRSTTALWETPQDFYDALPLASNAKCDRFFTPEQDGLLQDWGQAVCWCNAPYGLILRQWVQKAYEASKAGATVVMLLPVRSDTVWWHDYVQPYGEIRYLKGRLKFGGMANSAPFPSAVCIFRPPMR